MVPGGREVLGPLPIGLLEDVPVQAGLGGGHQRVVLGTQPELKVAHVVGRQLDPDLDGLASLVLPDKDASTVHASGLVVTGLKSDLRLITQGGSR